MINVTVSIWIVKADLVKFLSVGNVLKSDGTGLMGLTSEEQNHIKENKFNINTVAYPAMLQLNIPIQLYTALIIAFKIK